MMTEKGFATIFGLCLILVIALIVKGIQESEMNHVYETANFQTELELQNAADVRIYQAAAEVKKGLKDLPLHENFTAGTISVEIWGEKIDETNYKLFGKAEIENKHTGGKSYCRAFAYVKDNVIHFTK